MRVYRSGHGARVLLMLAMTGFAVATNFYALGALEGWGKVLAVGLTASVLATTSWVSVWVLHRNEEHLRARTLNDSVTDLPDRFLFVDHVNHS